VSTSGRFAKFAIFVHFDPEAVAGAMAERLTEAARLQRAARRLVDLEPRPAGPTDADRASTRLEHGIIDLPGPPIGFPCHHRPAEVDAV